MHGMHRHQTKRKRECVQKQGAETVYEHVKACQQHACNIPPHRRKSGGPQIRDERPKRIRREKEKERKRKRKTRKNCGSQAIIIKNRKKKINYSSRSQEERKIVKI